PNAVPPKNASAPARVESRSVEIARDRRSRTRRSASSTVLCWAWSSAGERWDCSSLVATIWAWRRSLPQARVGVASIELEGGLKATLLQVVRQYRHFHLAPARHVDVLTRSEPDRLALTRDATPDGD